MSQDHPTNSAVDDFETLTVCTPTTTADNTAHNSPKSERFHSSTPWPGRAFIIRSHETGKVITFLDGRIILDKAGGLGTFRWRCVEKKGWLGFRDPASAKYLGYDKQGGWVRCLVDKHNDWEYICPRKRPEGGYVLLVLLEKELVPLGVHVQETENGLEHRIKIKNWNSEGIVWDFIEVLC